MMGKASMTVCVVLFIAVLSTFLASCGEGNRIDVSKIPENVMNALNDKLPGGTVLSAITEEEGGKTLYEIKKKIGELLAQMAESSACIKIAIKQKYP